MADIKRMKEEKIARMEKVLIQHPPSLLASLPCFISSLSNPQPLTLLGTKAEGGRKEEGEEAAAP